MLTRVLFGALLAALGGTRLALPPLDDLGGLGPAVAVLEVAVGLLCVVHVTSAVGVVGSVSLLAGLATYNLARVVQGHGGEPCACHARGIDSTHYLTLVIVGVLLAWAAVLLSPIRLEATRVARVSVLLFGIGGVLVALLVLPTPQTQFPPYVPPAEAQPTQLGLATPTTEAKPTRPPDLAATAEPGTRVVKVRASWATSGEPVSAADIWWEGAGAQPDLFARTDPAGRAELTCPKVQGNLVGRSSDGVWSTAEVGTRDQAVALQFDDGVGIRVTTEDLAGNPVPGVALLMQGRGAERADAAGEHPDFADRYERRSVTTDESGGAVLRGSFPCTVTFMSATPGLRVMADRGMVLVRPTTEVVHIPVERVRTYRLTVVDSVSGVRAPPPVIVSLLGSLPDQKGALSGDESIPLLHLSGARFPLGSRARLRVQAHGYPPAEVDLYLAEDPTLYIPLVRDPASPPAGTVVLLMPEDFRRPLAWTRVSLLPLSAVGHPQDRVIEEDGQKWTIRDVAEGQYDIAYMGARLASDVQVTVGRTTSIAADTASFVSVRLRPVRRDRLPLRGRINVSVSPVGSGLMVGWTASIDDSGEVALGSFPRGPLDLLELGRTTEGLPARLRLRLEGTESIMRFDVTLNAQ